MYIPQNAYLLADEEGLLFDTLSPASTETVLAELDRRLGDDGLDYLVPSHPDVPHAGNAVAILEDHPVPWIAPIHGHPIAGDDADRYLDRLIDAAGRIADGYDVPE